MKHLEYNSEYGIYHLPDQKKFPYADGAERYIFETLNTLEDTSIFSPELKQKIKDWPSLYHFSSERQNIMRPFNIKKGMKVLEIGGGCGAITIYLAETQAEITTVEGSFERAANIRKRCKDAENVNVICANVQDLDFEEKFDVITLIGVFEYTARYSSFEAPYAQSLDFYRKLLKPTGKLVIAIENRLGLKYFCGFNEDHLGHPYKGLEDRYGQSGIRTFGKEEWVKMLKKAQFNDIDFFYPFPDYKLPKTILFEAGLEETQFNAADLISPLNINYYSGVRRINDSNIRLIWQYIYQNNLLGSLSNSFIVIASQEEDNAFFDTETLAIHYNSNRSENYNTQTRFVKEKDTILVKKELLEQRTASNQHEKINHSIGTEAYQVGRNLGCLLYRALENDDKKEFEALLAEWIDFLKKNTSLEKASSPSTAIIKPSYFDAIPSNIIKKEDDTLHYIDREWSVQYDFTLPYIVYRYLFRLEKHHRGLINRKYGDFNRFVRRILQDNGLEMIGNARLKQFSEWENRIHNHITPPSNTKIRKFSFNNIKKDIKYKLKHLYRIFLTDI